MTARLKAMYSPPPEVIGSFCPRAAERKARSRVEITELDDKEKVGLTTRGVRMHIIRRYRSRLADFEQFYFFAEPTQPLKALSVLETWHYDQGDDASPIPIIFGATVKPADVVTGYFHVPYELSTGDPQDLADFIGSEDGQAAIEADITAGNLEPITALSPGDLALFDIYALHKRCSFQPEDAGGLRLTVRAFGLD